MTPRIRSARYGGAPIVVLNTLAIPDPCGGEALRAAIEAAGERLQEELLSIFTAHRVDAAVHVGGLWGLSRIMPATGPGRRVLATHVVGHHINMTAALPPHRRGHRPLHGGAPARCCPGL